MYGSSMARPSARPARAPAGYGFPSSEDTLLAWDDVEQDLAEARVYWIGTTNADGSPRVRPIWGVWVDQRFYFTGHPRAGWARNLANDGRTCIQIEREDRALILEGLGDDVERADPELARAITDAWLRKYGRLAPDAAGDGIFRFTPARALGWSEDLRDGTVWSFDTPATIRT